MFRRHGTVRRQGIRRLLPSGLPLALAIVAGYVGVQVTVAQPADGARHRDRTAPSTPGAPNVSSAAPSAVVLGWHPATDNVRVAGYRVYLDGARKGITPGLAFGIAGLRCGTAYVAAVDAFDASGNRSKKASSTVSTSACSDSAAPSTPTGFKQLATTESTILLGWAASKDDIGVAGYGVYVGGLLVQTVSDTMTALEKLRCDSVYQVGVDSYDAAGNRSAKTTISVWTSACPDRQSPTAPSNVAVSASTTTSVTLGWSASSDNVGVSEYGVYTAGTRVASVSATGATVTGLLCGASYTLGVDAADAAGNRSAVSAVSAATSPCASSPPPSSPPPPPSSPPPPPSSPPPPPPADTQAPAKPALSLGSVTQTTLVLNWKAVSDNVGVDHYNVYRGTSARVAGQTKVGETKLLTYTYTGLACGTEYSLGLVAEDAAGNTSSLAEAIWHPVRTAACDSTPSTPPPPPATPAGDTQAPTAPTNVAATTRAATSLAITWSPSTDNVGVTGYGIYRAGSLVGTTSGTTGTFTGLTCGTNYTLAVDAVDAAGNRSPQTVVMVSTTSCGDTTPPSVPTAVTASNTTATSLTLNWKASTDNVAVAGYDVYKNGTKIGTATTPTYPVSGLTCATSSTFGVAAYDSAGNRSGQAQISASTAACAPLPSTGVAIRVSTSGNDSTCARGSTAVPCASLGKAFAIARCGDQVEIAAGSYSDQAIVESSVSPSCGGNPIVMRPTSGARPVFRHINVGVEDCAASGPDNLTLTGFSVVWGINVHGKVNNVVVDDFQGGSFAVGGCANNVTIKNSEWGPCNSGGGSGADCRTHNTSSPRDGQNKIAAGPTNIMIEGNTIHDYRITDDAHFECIWVGDGTNVTFHGNRFWNCVTNAIALPDTELAGTWLFENNWFGNPGSVNAALKFGLRGGCPSGTVIIRFNSFGPGSAVGNEESSLGNNACGRIHVVGNIQGHNYGCIGNAVYRYNLYLNDSGCDATDRTISALPYANPSGLSAGDYHLTGSTVADAFVPGSVANSDLSKDFDGDPRGGSRDAGADER